MYSYEIVIMHSCGYWFRLELYDIVMILYNQRIYNNFTKNLTWRVKNDTKTHSFIRNNSPKQSVLCMKFDERIRLTAHCLQ